MKKLIGLDIGTTNLKAEIYDVNGRFLDNVSLPYEIYFGQGNLAEQDARDWENNSIRVLNMLFEKYPDIAAVGLSTQGGTMVPVDGSLQPLRRAITWMDARGFSQKKKLLKSLSIDDIYNITGWRLQSIYPLLASLWLKENEPVNFKKAHKFLFVGDYIQQKLCGKSIVDFSNASITMLFDVLKKDWSQIILDIAGIDRARLSQTGPSVSVMGFLNNKALSSKSINTVLSNSGHDQYCVALSAEDNREDKLLLSTGTSWTVFKSTQKPFFNKYYYSPGVHIIPGKYGLLSVVPTGGSAFNWFLSNFFGTDNERAGFLKSAESDDCHIADEKNNTIFVPLFNGVFGPVWNNNISGCIDNLTFDTDRIKIYKAVLEGAAFQFKWIMQTLKETGMSFNGIKIIGGAAKSLAQCRIIADMTQETVFRPKDLNLNYACRGAAMLAGVSAGIFKNMDEASQVFREQKEAVYPNPLMKTYYDEKYSRYKERVNSKINSVSL